MQNQEKQLTSRVDILAQLFSSSKVRSRWEIFVELSYVGSKMRMTLLSHWLKSEVEQQKWKYMLPSLKNGVRDRFLPQGRRERKTYCLPFSSSFFFAKWLMHYYSEFIVWPDYHCIINLNNCDCHGNKAGMILSCLKKVYKLSLAFSFLHFWDKIYFGHYSSICVKLHQKEISCSKGWYIIRIVLPSLNLQKKLNISIKMKIEFRRKL